MGMFDYIQFEYPLPLPVDPKGYKLDTFQTKSLDNGLNTYKVDKDGILWIEKREVKYTERDKPTNNWYGNLPIIETVKTWWEPYVTTITIEFYDYIMSVDDMYDYSIEYKCEIVQGKLINVKLVNFEFTDNTERKKREAEYTERNREYYKFTQTNQYKYIYRPYNKTVSFIFRNVIKLLRYLECRLSKIENKIKI